MAGSLGHISGTVSLDINPFKQSTRVLQQQIKATGNAVRAQETAIKSSGKSINDLKSNYATMGKQLQQYNALLAQQKSQFESYKSSIKDVNGATDEQKNKLSRLENEYNKTAASTSRLEAKMQATARTIAIQDSGWTKAGEKLTKFGNATTTAGDKLTSLGRKATIGITAPIVGGFTAAAKSAIDFNSQISAIGPLLTNGGKITASVRSELDQMSSSSKKWAMQFGVSTDKINDGMTEMVKRGYTAQQTMGAMPAVLNAAKASGDDFNDVMHVSTSVLEQFGLKTTSTTDMLKNTSRVTDSLTYVANATAAGFQDMGEAMTYVGPSAHAAGISLEETAAAIGIMSNKGIEGSVAGTALRGALTRLMKPSKQNVAGFKAMGVSVEDFKKGTLTLPEIIDKIKTNTAGWTDQQRASSIAMAFGTEAQAGMNALISAGGDELRKYTKGAQDSAGTTKKIADQLNDTQAAKVARFKESIHVLGIEFGEKLLPTLVPVIEKLTSMIRGFSNMDSATQRSIIKWALFAAAIGPVSGALGNVLKVTGSVSNGLGGLFTMLGRVSGISKASKLGIEGTETALKGAGKGAGLFSSGLSLLNPYVLGTIAVVGAGVAVWELWGKKAVESSSRTTRWGSDVGKSADDALNKFKNAGKSISDSVTGIGKATEDSAKKVSDSLDKMTGQIETMAVKNREAFKKSIDDLPKSTQKALLKNYDEHQKANNREIKQANQKNNQVKAIMERASKEHRKLNADESTFISNNQRQLNKLMVDQIQVSGAKKKRILAALNSDYTKMTTSQQKEQYYVLQDGAQKENDLFAKQKKALQKNLKLGKIDNSAYKDAMADLRNTHEQTINAMTSKMAMLGTAMGRPKHMIVDDLMAMGLSFKEANKVVNTSQQGIDKSNGLIAKSTNDMSKKAQDAVSKWNSLIWDDKNVKVKSNAQEEVNKAAQSKDGWNQLTYDLKHANLSSNAKAMIGVAAIQSGRWDSLSWKEKKAMIASNSGAVVVKALQDSGQWNGLPFAVKQALVKSNSKAQVAQAVIDGNTWNTLPLKVKKMLANNADARTKLKQAGIDVDSYNSKGVPTKHMKGDSTSVKSHSNQGKVAVNSYNSTNPNSKNFKGNSTSVIQSGKSGRNSIQDFNSKNVNNKLFKGTDKTSGPGNNALGVLKNWNAFKPITHVFTSIFNTIKKNKHATGTNNSPGGPSILGDGGRPEPFYMPKSGFFGISPATDTPYNLERGTKVWSSVGKFMRDLPHFKNGTANNTRALGTLLKAGKISDSKSSIINQTVQVSNFSGLEEKLDKLDKLDEVLGYLSKILVKNPNLIMDGKRVSKIVEPGVSKNQMQNNVLTERGVFSG